MAGRADAGRQPGLAAAKRRFPDRCEAIERLAQRDENFRDICEELADAEVMLTATGSGPTDSPEERRRRQLEWQGLVDRLVKEISEGLCKENIIPIGRLPRRQRR